MPEVTLVSHTPDPEHVIESAYLSCQSRHSNLERIRTRRSLAERIEDIFKSGHYGVLEHASATFRIEELSRSCTHQLVRHRLASYAQLSMRHVEPGKLNTIIPPSIFMDDDAFDAYIDAFDKCRDTYDKLRKLGIKKEDARFIIPMGIETQITITMNFRSLIHLFKLRTSKKAQWEIRGMAISMWYQMEKIAPNVFNPKYEEMWE